MPPTARAALLLALLAAAGCTVTGVAPPSGVQAASGGGLQYLGEPGAHAP